MKERIDELRAQADALLRQADEIEAAQRANYKGHSLSLLDAATGSLSSLLDVIAKSPYVAREKLAGIEPGTHCLVSISIVQADNGTAIQVHLSKYGRELEGAFGIEPTAGGGFFHANGSDQ